MNRFRVRRTADTLIIQRQAALFRVGKRWTTVATGKWRTVATLDRVWAANLAAELDAWLSGTDQIPEL